MNMNVVLLSKINVAKCHDVNKFGIDSLQQQVPYFFLFPEQFEESYPDRKWFNLVFNKISLFSLEIMFLNKI